MVRFVHRRLRAVGGKRGCFFASRFASYLADFRSPRKPHGLLCAQKDGDHRRPKALIVNDSASSYAFEETPTKMDEFRWNSVIVGHFRSGFFEEVLCSYHKLKLRGLGVDSSVVTFSLKSCAALGSVCYGRIIHTDAMKTSLNRQKFVGSSLVDLYSRCGEIGDAREVFEDCIDRDVVVFTSLICGYSKSASFRAWEAFRIARQMHEEGFHANRVTLICLLEAAGRLEVLNAGKSVHGFALRRGIGFTDDVLHTGLVGMYARCYSMAAAKSVLNSRKRCVASWNSLIASLAYWGKSSGALDVFHQMMDEGHVSPDSITLTSILSVCSNLKCARHVLSIHGYIFRNGVALDLVVVTALVDFYSRCNRMRSARKLLDLASSRDTVLYNVLILGYFRNGMDEDAAEVFHVMVRKGAGLNRDTVLGLLSRYADLKDMKGGRSGHAVVIKRGFQFGTDASNQVLNLYSKCGCIDAAKKVFESIAEKDLVSWTTMMMGYLSHGLADQCVMLFQLMQEKGVKPDTTTVSTLFRSLSQLGSLYGIRELHGYVYRHYLVWDAMSTNSMITAYAECGSLDVAKALFACMAERGLASWNAMISAYGKHGYCKKAMELFDQVQNMEPDAKTFTSVLAACSHAGFVEDGLRAFGLMSTRYSLAPSEEHYNCMVDLLGRAGKLEEAVASAKCLPLRDRGCAYRALLAACRDRRDTKLGEVISREFADLEPPSCSAAALASSIYAQNGRWVDAACLRAAAAGEEGLMKTPGLSLLRQAVG